MLRARTDGWWRAVKLGVLTLVLVDCVGAANSIPIPASSSPSPSTTTSPTNDGGARQGAPNNSATSLIPTVAGTELSGSAAALEITTNAAFVDNQRYHGRVFLLLDYRGAAGGPSFPADFPDALARIIRDAGGDRFDLQQSWRVHRSGALLLDSGGDGIVFDASGTRYGTLAGGASGLQPRYYEPYWHQSDAGTQINCKKDDCAHRFDRTANRYTFSFAASSVEISPIKVHCSDAHLLKVVVKDGRGGQLLLRDMLSTTVVEHDSDGDGTAELYFVSVLACARSLKVIMVVPKLGL